MSIAHCENCARIYLETLEDEAMCDVHLAEQEAAYRVYGLEEQVNGDIEEFDDSVVHITVQASGNTMSVYKNLMGRPPGVGDKLVFTPDEVRHMFGIDPRAS